MTIGVAMFSVGSGGSSTTRRLLGSGEVDASDIVEDDAKRTSGGRESAVMSFFDARPRLMRVNGRDGPPLSSSAVLDPETRLQVAQETNVSSTAQSCIRCDATFISIHM